MNSENTPSEQAKNDAALRRASISKRDIEEALDYLNSFATNQPATIQRALLVAAIVSYSRPFSGNNGGREQQSSRKVDIDPKQALNEQELALHCKIIELRDKEVAHSDFDAKPVIIVQRDSTGVVMGGKLSDPLSHPIRIDDFKSLCEKIENKCVELIFNHGPRR